MAKNKKKRNGNGGNAPKGNRNATRQERELRKTSAPSRYAKKHLGGKLHLRRRRRSSSRSSASPARWATLSYNIFSTLFGWGYLILPATLLFAAIVFLFSERKKLVGITLFGATLLIFSVLGLIELFYPTKGGWFGLVLGSLRVPFGQIAAVIVNGFILVIAVLVTANVPIKTDWFKKTNENEEEAEDEESLVVTGTEEKPVETKTNGKKEKTAPKADEKETEELSASVVEPKELSTSKERKMKAPVFANYVPPPLSLLKSEAGKPTTGDLLANANIIKRTLESFGVAVEMGEINVGPAVTRYTLKPAEGMKLSRITALSSDLSLSLAAHPIRIEAPIPGKSLVGIEVPNKAAALVRLGSLMHYPEFQKNSLGFILGRDVSGEPMFGDIEKMPHLLVAGATGSGKSIFIHSLIVSLLYKNSPQSMKLVLIDPKRVELSIYEGIPHLVSPVVTENKKAAGVFRWAITEMDRRYNTLQQAGCRDIKSYNGSHPSESLPYIVIIIDELADLMTSYGREVEASIVRLAQMARATGRSISSSQRSDRRLKSSRDSSKRTSPRAWRFRSRARSIRGPSSTHPAPKNSWATVTSCFSPRNFRNRNASRVRSSPRKK